MAFVIGLTGNIASGKSLVAELLAQRGAEVIDADRIAHEVMQAGTDEARAIAARFGPAVMNMDGSVNRAALAPIVFADPAAMADLEKIVHPGVRRRVQARLARSTAPVVVLEAIKLLEGPLVDWCDTVWVVTAPRELRLQRLIRDRGLTPEAAAARIDAQSPEEDKVKRANVVLRNDGTPEELARQVADAWLHSVRIAAR